MKIVDTNVLMHETNLIELLKEYDNIHIPVEVLSELDNLKVKDGKPGYLARCGVRNIRDNIEQVDFLMHEDNKQFNRLNMIVDDIIIEHCKENPGSTLITNDLNMEIKAGAYGISVMNYYGKEEEVEDPVKVVDMNTLEFQDFLENKYSPKTKEVAIGQFVAIEDKGCRLGTYRFLGEGMWDPVRERESIKSISYDVTARDIYQSCAIKSLHDDDFTILTGAAGTGKTLIALGYCLEEMSKTGATINIFVNPVKTRDSQDLGYYPGTRNEKLLENFIGAVLASKLGDVEEVYRLMSIGALKIHPFSDIRGIEIGPGDIMYITEGQNLSIDLMRLAIQRCADGSKLVIEGDCQAQVDRHSFEGENNGLQRAIEVFTGTDKCDFGHVDLPIIYRSRMAQVAEEL